jgi:hypothetical protein
VAPLITALLGTIALLVALSLLILAGWWLVLRIIDPLLESSRMSVQQERILRHHELLERHRQERARQLARQRHRVVDLNGQVCWLLPDELRGFLRSCWVELELAEGSAWSVVRQHWRRSSLRWHPDHGGDPVVWLRKQRAYEALKSARAQQAKAMPPRQAPPRPPRRCPGPPQPDARDPETPSPNRYGHRGAGCRGAAGRRR